jgi:hypothetical protein
VLHRRDAVAEPLPPSTPLNGDRGVAHRSRRHPPIIAVLAASTLPDVSANADGPLLSADEWFAHQIVETHAYVAESDRSWTEKVCAMAAARDGSLQVGFGVGKYTNRGVFDGYASISRGREQWTVRASRRLADAPDLLGAGPLTYEIVEPLRTVRFACAPNDAVPIAFEWTFTAVAPPVLEARDRSRARGGYRMDTHLLRYHQTGLATGWVDVDGERTEITETDWFTTRDHSWGVRHDVGQPPTDLEPAAGLGPGVGFRFSWSPMLLERADGTRYAMHHQYRETSAFGYSEKRFEGTVEEPDGTVQTMRAVVPDLRFDPANRRVLGGTLTFTMGDGSVRPVVVEALGDTGIHLGAGLYFGFDGHHHGDWRGALHVDGEHIPDCTDTAVAPRLHQIRDAVMRVSDPVGGGEGWCNMQTIVVGGWPELGLAEETSFI